MVAVQLDDGALPDDPPAQLRYRRRVRPGAAVAEVWRARPLVRSLVERELRVRYKQTVLGAAWAVLTPLALMAVFTLFFRRVVPVANRDVPYPLFVYLALIPWNFFSTSVSQGGLSLLTNVALLTKVYCPREVFPLASIGVAAVDGLVASAALVVLFVIYHRAPQPTSVWVPLLFAVQLAFCAGVVLVISSVVLYLRDLRHVLPLLLQVGLFATPIAYGLETVPVRWRPLYALVNPLAPVIDGYRRTVLYGRAPALGLLGLGALTSVVLLVGGYLLFKRLETGFADIA